MLEKQTWKERALSTAKYHSLKLKEDESWTIRDTADSLHRSVGSISEDILIANWYRTHPAAIDSFKTASAAMRWIKAKKREMELYGIE